MALITENVPGGDRVIAKLAKLHVAKRTVRRVLDEVEKQAANDEHASDLLSALCADASLLPTPTRQSLATLIKSNCITEVLTIKPRTSIFGRMNCLAR
jgi:hypothetical protein